MLQKDSNTHFWKARLCSVKWNLGHPPTVLQATAAADSPVHIPAIPCFYWPVMPCQEPEEEGMWGSEQLRGKQGEDTEKEDARRNGRSRQRKREPQERGVRYTWKSISPGGFWQTQGKLSTGEASGMGKRQAGRSAFGEDMSKCDSCLIHYCDLKHVNCKPARPQRKAWGKLCINYQEASLASPRIIPQHQVPDRWVCPKSSSEKRKLKPMLHTCLLWNALWRESGEYLKGGNLAE